VRRVILKGLLARKLRLLLTAVSISLGVAFVSGTFVLGDTMTATFDQLYEGLTEGTDVTVRGESAFTDTSTLGATRPFDAAVLDQVRQVEGVAAAEGSVTGYALILDKAGEPVQPGGAPTLGASHTTDADLAGGFTLREGRAPAGPADVVLDAATAKTHGFAPGDPVTVLFQAGPRDFTVTGIAGFGEADNLAGATMATFDLATAQEVLGKAGVYDAIAVRGGDVRPDELRDRVSAVLPDGLEAVTSSEVVAESSAAVADALQFFTTGLLGFAAISLLVGALIIWNTFSILVAQRTRELALLRAVGATRRQVRTSVVVEALVIGLVAAGLGLALGVGVAAGLRAALAAIGIEVPTTTLQVAPRTVLAALAVGVVVTVLAALLPARQATKVPPVAALRSVDAPARPVGRTRVALGAVLTGIGTVALVVSLLQDGRLALAGVGMLLTLSGVLTLAPVVAVAVTRVLGALVVRVGGPSAALARRNALRNPRRTANTATALMIGLALVSTVTVVASSMKASVADVVADSNRADFILKAASQASPGLPPALAEDLRAVEGVGTVSELRFASAQVGGASSFVAGIDPATVDTAADLQVGSGSIADLGPGAVLVSDDVAQAEGWSVGDVLSITYAQTGAQQVRIAGTFGNTALLGSDYAVDLGTLTANTGSSLDIAVLVVAADGVDAADLRPALEEVVDAYPIAQLDDEASFTESQAQTIDQLLGIVTMLLALAVIIALLGIVNTLALSVFERTRELGLLRAVGTTRRQVRAVVRWESVIVAVLGALLGAVLGLAFGAALTRGLAGEGLSVLEIPSGRLGAYVVAAALAGVLAAIGPARRAAKVDVLRAVAAT
jgi:putative ABC transport system permease protein